MQGTYIRTSILPDSKTSTPAISYKESAQFYTLEHALPDSTKKPSWKSRVRDKQMWYDIENKRWAIGDARDNFAYILGKTQDHFSMPCAENSWKYRNFETGNFDTPFGYGQSGEANEIHIQCKGMLSNQKYCFSISIIFHIFFVRSTQKVLLKCERF